MCVRPVPVWVHFGAMSAVMRALAAAEMAAVTGESRENVVLVKVDKIDKLIGTYPNYFGDVSLFVRNLRPACSGKPDVDYTVAAPEIVKSVKQEIGDPRALRRHYGQWAERVK